MRIFLILLLNLTLATAALANDWDALESPTAIALMRHALAPGTSDPAAFQLDVCTTQRNLSDQGRTQASRIGQALKQRRISFDAVWTSQWCRCRDTANLLDIAPVRDEPALNSFFQDRRTEPQQSSKTLSLLQNHTGGRLMLVTHQVNITALTGVVPRSGEIIVVERTTSGLQTTGRILIAP